MSRLLVAMTMVFALVLAAGAHSLNPGVWSPQSSEDERPDNEEMTAGAAHHMIYLHGETVEDMGARASHPEPGVYRYQEILDAWTARGFTVHAEVRPTNADQAEWARITASQIRDILGLGVPPQRITEIGFGKGGAIAVLASTLLDNDDVCYVLLATCGDAISDLPPGQAAHGHVLSIRDVDDDMTRKCTDLRDRLARSASLSEVAITSGDGRGVFYGPRPEWMKLAITWALGWGSRF